VVEGKFPVGVGHEAEEIAVEEPHHDGTDDHGDDRDDEPDAQLGQMLEKGHLAELVLGGLLLRCGLGMG
jgi:hypothetical protein